MVLLDFQRDCDKLIGTLIVVYFIFLSSTGPPAILDHLFTQSVPWSKFMYLKHRKTTSFSHFESLLAQIWKVLATCACLQCCSRLPISPIHRSQNTEKKSQCPFVIASIVAHAFGTIPKGHWEHFLNQRLYNSESVLKLRLWFSLVNLQYS